MTTLGADAYGLSQIKTWVQKVKNGDLSCKDAPRTGWPPLTLGATCGISSKASFFSARAPTQHLLTNVPRIQEILQRELELTKFSRR
jgi:hypothetical protein